MEREAAQRRLEKLLPTAGDVLEAFLEKQRRMKCPECHKWITAKLPDSLALKAALATMDRAGVGPTKTTVHERKALTGSSVKQLQGLTRELLSLPLEDRVVLAKSILPEYAPPLKELSPAPSSNNGESQEGATSSPENA